MRERAASRRGSEAGGVGVGPAGPGCRGSSLLGRSSPSTGSVFKAGLGGISRFKSFPGNWNVSKVSTVMSGVGGCQNE